MVPLDQAREKVDPDITLCGNFDPSTVLLQGTPQIVADAAKDCIQKPGERFILMPGCEVPQNTPEGMLHNLFSCLVVNIISVGELTLQGRCNFYIRNGFRVVRVFDNNLNEFYACIDIESFYCRFSWCEIVVESV